jgi:hypothetical protein
LKELDGSARIRLQVLVAKQAGQVADKPLFLSGGLSFFRGSGDSALPKKK